MGLYTEATSSFDEKELSTSDLLEIGVGMDMKDVEMAINKRPVTSTRLPLACRRRCDCDLMSQRACNFCKLLKRECCEVNICASEA
ncbi:hypothetical protein ElyMa_001075200 [Elysia marginata]|uniref:ARF7 effector protein C-terminal domain-containing protein n=1 Tax=Elysia marginata TaxID=1093978 RepID=A0AAV4HT19_9GAST|nr:hypothetical protein ElyMa_001075200 [Elysia marginata]